MIGFHGIAPSEFWGMTPAEAFFLINAKKKQQQVGKVTFADVEDLADTYEKLGLTA